MPNLYLDRYAWPGPLLSEEPDKKLGMIAVIPCLLEPHIINTLECLNSCALPPCSVEVIAVVNHSEQASEEVRRFNSDTVKRIRAWAEDRFDRMRRYHVIEALELPARWAGVGLARKIGMDEAVRRFEHTGNRHGIILCLDADCTCLPDYLCAVYSGFRDDPKPTCALLYFEHPYRDIPGGQLRRSIVVYELHLRYHVASLKSAGHPYPYHTVGSCMAVRSDVYQSQGGMNRRKAGEDFYFLQKIFPSGYTRRINSTTVYPGIRPSARVPFGTGAYLQRALQNPDATAMTYHWNSYRDLAAVYSSADDLFDASETIIAKVIGSWPESIRAFVSAEDVVDTLTRMIRSTGKSAAFRTRYFRWFDGLRTLRFLNFARNGFYPDVEVTTAVRHLFLNHLRLPWNDDIEKLLETFRCYERTLT